MKTNEKKSNMGRFFLSLLFALMALAEIFLVFQVWSLHLLPGKYLLLLAGIFAVLDGLVFLLLRRAKVGKWQRRSLRPRQVIGAILAGLLILLCLMGIRVVFQVGDTLDAITAPQTTTALMSVYVLTDDPAESLEDARDYTFGITSATDADSNQGAVEQMEEELGSAISLQSYESVAALIDALYAGDVDAIILDDAFVTVIVSMDGYEDFSDRVRLITERTVIKQVDTAGETSQATSTRTVDVATTPFLVYISGNDARLAELADGGSDVNILMAVNPVDHQILLVNTPRDYYVVNPASGNGSKDKLSHCGLAGIDNCIQAISLLYDIEIDYYARINFSGFRTLVDALGGVTVYSEYAFSSGNYSFVQGYNTLNGSQALAFARERKAFASGDNQRGKNQMALIQGIISQLSASTIIANYADILDSLEGMFATSMSTQDIGKLVDLQLSGMPSWEVLTFAVTGDNGNNSCWAVGGGYGYVMYPHEYMVSHASDLIGRVLAGEVLTEADLVATES